MESILPKEPIEPTRVYTPKEAKRVLGIGLHKLYTLIRSKNGKPQIPSKKLGRGYKILGEHLLEFMRSKK